MEINTRKMSSQLAFFESYLNKDSGGSSLFFLLQIHVFTSYQIRTNAFDRNNSHQISLLSFQMRWKSFKRINCCQSRLTIYRSPNFFAPLIIERKSYALFVHPFFMVVVVVVVVNGEKNEGPAFQNVLTSHKIHNNPKISRH